MLPVAQSLAEFAQENQSGAWITTIPEYEEIVAAWKNGVQASMIRAWLIEKGYEPADVNVDKVAAYLRRHYPR